ncbi:MAG: YjjG family noncanonical pyrimidine nucleotidase [Muribaculaceae bacterium]|nr:YjjG family noncanonical pyrimidine nucleotidase [Muribaculaceae bacterium]
MTPKWIFFDLDDTLFDFSSASLISLRKLWNETPEIRSKFDDVESWISEYHIHNKHMWDLHERGEISADFLKAERFRLTLMPHRKDEAAIKFSRALNDRYLWLLGECDSTCKGAKELLETLSKKYLIGVLTNGFTEVQYRKLRTTGLDRYIQRMVISDEIGIQKPDARLFRYAESETGAKAESTIMIGDNPQNDIMGAIDAGWNAIYYDWKGKLIDTDSVQLLGKTNNLLDVADMLKV